MAVQVGELFAKLGLEKKEFDQGLASAGKEFEQTGSRFGKVSSMMGGVLTTAGGFLAANVIAGIGSQFSGLATQMVSSNAQFEDYGVRFKTLIGNSEDFKQSIAGVTDPLERQALAAKAAEQRMAELAQFGATTPFELPGVVEADTILQGFGLHSEESAKKFGFSGEQIRTIAGDVASGTGAQFNEMSLLLGKFSSGATGEAISRMMELGITSREELGKMGLEFSKSGELLSPLPESMNAVLTLMQDKYGGLMQAQSLTFNGMMSNLQDWVAGTIRTLGAPIFDVAKEQLSGLLTLLNDPATQAGIAAFAEQLASGIGTALEFIVTTAIPAFVAGWGLLQGAFTAVQPFIQMFADALVSIIIPALATVYPYVESFATTLSDLLIPATQIASDILANMGPILAELAGMLAGDSEAFLAFGQTIHSIFGEQLGPVVAEFVATFIERLQLLISTAQEIFSSLQDIFITVFGIISGFVAEHGAEIVSTLMGAWTTIQGAINTAIEVVRDIVTTVLGVVASFLASHSSEITALLSQAWSTIQTVIQAATRIIDGLVIPLFQGIGSFIAAHASTIQAVLSAAWQVISSAISGSLNIIQGLITAVMAAIQGDWAGAWAGIQQALSGAWQAIQGIVQGGIALVQSVLSLAWAAILAAATGAWNMLSTMILSALQGIGSAISSAFAGAVAAVRQAGADMVASALSIGSNIIQGIVNGISSGVGAIKAAVTNAAKQALDAAKSFLGIHSPAKKLKEEVGKPISEGISEGIKDEGKKKEIKEAVTSTLDEAVKKAADAIRAGAEAFGLIGEIVLPAREKIQEFTVALRDTVADFYDQSRVIGYALKESTLLFADVAGKSVDALGKGVKAFEEIDGFTAPPREKLTALAVAMRDAVTDFWHEAKNVLYALKDDIAPRFAEQVGKVVDAIGKAVKGFSDLEEFEAPPREKLTALAQTITEAMHEFWDVMQHHLGITQDAEIPAFADRIGKVVDALGKAIKSFEGLTEFEAPPQASLDALAQSLVEALHTFWEVMQEHLGMAQDEALPEFAEAVGKIIDTVGKSVEAFSELKDYKDVSSDTFKLLKDDIAEATRLMILIATTSEREGVEAAAEFSEAVIKVFDAISGGIEALDSLREYESVAPIRMEMIAADIYQATWWMAEIAKNADREGVARARDFSEAVHSIFDLVSTGTEAIDSLRDYQSLPKDRLASFLSDLRDAISTITTMVGDAERFEDRAREIAESMEDAAEAMREALEDFRDAIEDYEELQDLKDQYPDIAGGSSSSFSLSDTKALASLPGAVTLAGAGSAGIAGTNNWNLSVYTQQSLGSIQAEFDMMRVLVG